MAEERPTAEMPFLDHLEELRWRIIWSLAALAVALGVAFYLVTQLKAIAFLQRPILPYLNGRQLVYTHPGDPISIVMTVTFALGGVLASPVILYQIWAFLSPALYKHEKRVVLPLLLAATLLFVAGVTVAYLVVLPFTLSFLLGFQDSSLDAMITAKDYFDFATGMSLAFGAVFEMPILIVLLTAFGIVTPLFLQRFRRYAIVLCVIAAAVITPGDAATATVVLVGPLYGLYELSIILARVVHRRRLASAARAEEARLAEEGGLA
jgi:sec-independent protein translocase protein TatC